MRMTLSSMVASFFLLVVALGGAEARSATSPHGIGPLVGLTSDPDQFLIGGQGVFALSGMPLNLSPSLDFGAGDHVNVVTMNFDLTYTLVPRDSRLSFYLGAGPTMAFYSSDDFDNGSELGLSLVSGLSIPNRKGDRCNLGVRFGVGDIPDIKFTASWLFGLK